MSDYSAVLFDLDGTLIDSAPGIFAALEATLAQYDIHPERSSLQKYLGPPLRKTFADFLPPEKIEAAVAHYRALYKVMGLENVAPYGGIKETLCALRKEGKTVCVATSKPRPVALQVLRAFDMEQYFDYVGGASMDSSLDTKTAVVAHVLAQPCLYGKNAVMVGDRDNDMQGAADCGIPAVGVLYGYGNEAELSAFSPQYLAKTPAALCACLMN